ncbi:GDNF-inducible zinc finger protein 1-like isoform X2 [Diorhabda carinulata]|uniref:GDNF-inducible zinc finger protein 1-like isoform X2 n=1 Tax=Diorhabda carinulata TaxID=1163345 RepID=UPI0025A24605|nr:GDNF-inducible zinc finger protein 1-like isoform X2 [Diorhabda carinulata]
MAIADDQHFCLKWNNFQANITSQFETLRYDEDFTDVTIACDGQRLQAHKVVLSACSPFFKELFKTNPCPHPIIFMRDVEAKHITSLIEFMYAGEVNIAQAHLSTFLKTAESLKIRGLTDTTSDLQKEDDTQDTVYSQHSSKHKLNKSPNPNSTVTSSQDVPETLLPPSSPPTKKVCKSETESLSSKQENVAVSVFNLKDITENKNKEFTKTTQPKLELPDYLSDVADDEDGREDNEGLLGLFPTTHIREMSGGMEIIPQSSGFYEKDTKHEQLGHGNDIRKLHSLDPRPCEECGKVYSNLSNLRQHMRLIHYPTYVQCVYCQKQFKTDLYLRRHVISAHNNTNLGFYKYAGQSEKTNKFFDLNQDKNDSKIKMINYKSQN